MHGFVSVILKRCRKVSGEKLGNDCCDHIFAELIFDRRFALKLCRIWGGIAGKYEREIAKTHTGRQDENVPTGLASGFILDTAIYTAHWG